ncbi:MAG: 50S ribosomal protein L4 [Chloroflexota bacterium]
MTEIAVRNLSGEQVDTITVSDAVFAQPLNEALMHQAVTRILANRRAGTHSAKTRSEVSGTGAKAYRQKGTGRARHGAKTAPVFRGGGVAFPPIPRSYQLDMPKKMRRAAMRSALSARVSGERFVAVSSLVPEEARTQVMASALKNLNATGKVLLVDERIAVETQRAARNIEGVTLKPAASLNIVDVLNYDMLVMGVAGLRQLEGMLAHANA